MFQDLLIIISNRLQKCFRLTTFMSLLILMNIVFILVSVATVVVVYLVLPVSLLFLGSIVFSMNDQIPACIV